MKDNPMEHSLRVKLVNHFVSCSLFFLAFVIFAKTAERVLTEKQRGMELGYDITRALVTNRVTTMAYVICDMPGTNGDYRIDFPVTNHVVESVGTEWIKE